MIEKKMQGRNRNKLVFSKFPLVPFIGSLTRFQGTSTSIIHPRVHSIPFQEEEKGEDEEEKPEQKWKYGNREKHISQMDVVHYSPSVVRLQNANKVITCRFLVQPTLSVHCSKISFCLVYEPVHVFPLPMYPVLQVQLYEPILLLHCAFMWQKGGETVHSSTSGKITIKN